MTPDEYVTVKCKRCKREYGFFPMRVMYLGHCRCGNSNHGSPSRWDEDDFGNFTLVRRVEWKIPVFPMMFP